MASILDRVLAAERSGRRLSLLDRTLAEDEAARRTAESFTQTEQRLRDQGPIRDVDILRTAPPPPSPDASKMEQLQAKLDRQRWERESVRRGKQRRADEDALSHDEAQTYSEYATLNAAEMPTGQVGEIDFEAAARREAEQQRLAIDDSSWWDTLKKSVQNLDDSIIGRGGGGIIESLPTTMRYLSAALGNSAALMQPKTDVEQSVEDIGKGIFDRASAEIERNSPELDGSPGKKFAYDLINAFSSLATAVGVSAATKNPQAGLAILGAQTFGDRFGQSIEEGRSRDQAFGDAAIFAIAEVVGENKVIGDLIKPGVGFATRVGKGALGEAIQEGATSVIQNGYAKGVLYPEMTMGDVTRAILRDMALGGAAGAGSAVVGQAVAGSQAKADQRSAIDELAQTNFPTDEAAARAMQAPGTATLTDPLPRRGIVEQARAAANISPEDEASPIPTDLIQQGKATVAADAASQVASDLLSREGISGVGQRVIIDMGGGRLQFGTIADAFTTNDPNHGENSGVRIDLDTGGTFEEYFTDIRNSGVTIKPVDQALAEMAVDTVVGIPDDDTRAVGPAPRRAPPSPGKGADLLSRMIPITLRAESGDRDRDAQGNVITSPKGAQGRMQVMPGTNTDPGFGVRPAQDDSLEERARVGRDYLDAMLRRYGGDPAKAWAAYNAGPGRVDNAIAKYGDAWLDHVPAETRAYVRNNVAKLGRPGEAYTEAERPAQQPDQAPAPDDNTFLEEPARETAFTPVAEGVRLADLLARDAEVRTAPSAESAQPLIDRNEPVAAVEGKRVVVRNISAEQRSVIDEALPGKVRLLPRSDGSYTVPARYEVAVKSVVKALGRDGPQEVIGNGTREAPLRLTQEAHVEEIANHVAEPTDAQREAGNYKLGHVKIHGLDISVETPRNGIRKETGPDGSISEIQTPAAYGYVKRTNGADDEQVNVFIGPSPQASTVYVIDQQNTDTGKFDEHKAMIGFDSREEAMSTYQASFSDGRGGDRIAGVAEMDIGQFKDWLATDPKRPISTETSVVPPIATDAAPAVASSPEAAGATLSLENVLRQDRGEVAPEISTPAPVFEAPDSETQVGGPGQPSNETASTGSSEATFDPRSFVPKLREIVTQTKINLNDTKRLARAIGVTPEQANAVMGALASQPNAGFAMTKGRKATMRKVLVAPARRDRTGKRVPASYKYVEVRPAVAPRYQRLPRRQAPLDVIAFLRSRGGVRNDESHDLRNLGAVARHPGLISRRGLSIDAAGEALHEAGYIGPERPTEAEVLDLLDRASLSPTYRPEDHIDQRTGPEDAEQRAAIEALADDIGLTIADRDIVGALVYMEAGVSPAEALGQAMDDAAHEALEIGDRETENDFYGAEAEAVYGGDIAEQRDSGSQETVIGPESVEGYAQRSPEADAQPTGAVEAREGAGAQAIDFLGEPIAQPEVKAATLKEDAQLDAFGERPEDARKALERKAEGRDQSSATQKAPGSDGGLFDNNEGDAELFKIQGEAIPPVEEETTAQWRDKLNAELRRLKIDDKVTLRVVNKLEAGPTIAGSYYRRAIAVALDVSRDPIETLSHESIHALRGMGLIREPEWTALEKAVQEWPGLMSDVRKRYGVQRLSDLQMTEEAVADLYGMWRSERAKVRGFVAQVFQRIADFIKTIRAAFSRETMPGQIFRDIEAGRVGQREGQEVEPRAPQFATVSPRTAGDVATQDGTGGRGGGTGRGAVSTSPQFNDPETEARWQDARKGLGDGPGLIETAKGWWEDVVAGFTRHWRDLPNEPRFSDLAQQFRKLESSPTAAKERTVRLLRDLVGKMNRDQLDLFTRKVVIDDLTWEADAERKLPFGFTAETLVVEKAKIDRLIGQNPDLVDAVRKRKLINREIADEMVSAGVLSREQIRNPAYFRHMVLDYARAEMRLAKGTGQKIKSPYWAKRMGSTLDINAHLLEAEFEWLQKAQVDIATAKMIDWLKKSDHNIREDLRAKAKALNDETLSQILNENEEAATQAKAFKKNIAIGMKKVADAVEGDQLGIIPDHLQAAAAKLTGTEGDESIFPLLAWMLDNDKPGAIGAAMVLKAAGQRKSWERSLLGSKYIDVSDTPGLVKKLAPDGYSAWQPIEGRHLFTAKTVPEHILEGFVEKLSAPNVSGINADEMHRALTAVRQQLVVGGERYTMVLPKEVADTLNEFGDRRAEGLFSQGVQMLQSGWKRWVLINPRRFLKYNLNNISGDLDALIAGNPGALLKVKIAAKELYAVMRKGEKPSARYGEAVERGVFDSGLSIQEIPDISRLSAFRHLTDDHGSGRPDKFLIQTAGNIWRALQGTTQWRENVFRYASYLDYVEKIEAGKPTGYGASVPKMVDAVKDPKDKAALLARDLIGDYGSISVAGGWLRQHLIPFWSWTEINTKRYWRLTKNASSQGLGKGIATGGLLAISSGARTSAALFLRMAIVYGLINLWNNLLFGDEEDDLGEQQQRQMHLILGRYGDEIVTLRLQGALSDVLGLMGLPDAVAAFKKYLDEQGSMDGVIAEMAKAPVNKVATGVNPFIGVPLEQALGKELWPDIFSPRDIKDRWRHIFSTFSLENEYDFAFAKPSRGYGRSWEESVVYRRDPGEMAYDEAKGIAYDWLARVKGEDSTGSRTSPRSTALREYRQALRFGDERAAEMALAKYESFGGTDRGFAASIKRAHPLGPIAKKDRKVFLESLTPDQYETFADAERWYDETFLDQE